LLTTFPSIWLLQLSQYELTVQGTTSSQNGTYLLPHSERIYMTSPNATNDTDVQNVTTEATTTTTDSVLFVSVS